MNNVEPKPLCIMAVHEDGMHVFLEDGSSWDIHPGSIDQGCFLGSISAGHDRES